MIVEMITPEFLSEWRKGISLTQSRLAEIMRVNLRTIRRWENGEREIPPYLGFVMAAIEAGIEPIGLTAKPQTERAAEAAHAVEESD